MIVSNRMHTHLYLFNVSLYMCSVKQVFPNLEFLGWYTNCEKLEDVEYQFHQQLCQENESYLLLTINPFSRSNEV